MSDIRDMPMRFVSDGVGERSGNYPERLLRLIDEGHVDGALPGTDACSGIIADIACGLSYLLAQPERILTAGACRCKLFIRFAGKVMF